MYLDISHCYLLYRSSSRALSPSLFLSPFAHRSRASRSALTFRLPFFFFLIRSSYSSSLATSLSLRSLPLGTLVIETRNRYKNITLSVSDSEPRARIPRDDTTMFTFLDIRTIRTFEESSNRCSRFRSNLFSFLLLPLRVAHHALYLNVRFPYGDT